jgi:hypothetical protein
VFLALFAGIQVKEYERVTLWYIHHWEANPGSFRTIPRQCGSSPSTGRSTSRRSLRTLVTRL